MSPIVTNGHAHGRVHTSPNATNEMPLPGNSQTNHAHTRKNADAHKKKDSKQQIYELPESHTI